MYSDHFGLTGQPFQLTPDARFWFESRTHKKAMAYLGYGLAQGEGFIVVTGEIGAGKSTLVAHLMATIDRARLNAIPLVSTQVEGDDVLRLAAQGLGVATRGVEKAALLDAVEQRLDEETRARLDNALRAKHLEKGLRQLCEEGAIQLFRPLASNDYVLGAVGPLQFDVIATRLAGEYNVDVRLDTLSYQTARWVTCDDAKVLQDFTRAQEFNLARDIHGDLVYLADSTFWLDRAKEKWPKVAFHATREHT